ncbi:MAG: hypothetical protein QUS35_02060 [bacterium]|nr:hypothetical protein [bacterium]
MTPIWDDLKKSVKDGLSVAAAKTEEYTRIGKAKLDLMNLNKSLNAAYHDLGVTVYQQASAETKKNAAQDPKVKDHIGRIEKLLQDVRDKEKEIEEIRKGSAAPSKSAGESGKTTETGADVDSKA